MRYHIFWTIFLILLSPLSFAQWQKINELDYTWGPFKIYNIALFTETGEYEVNHPPVMLRLTYDKPVDGRDFAISIARSWSNLGIKFPEQNKVIERLRKRLPDLKPQDVLYYIGLPDKGYFIVNDRIIPEYFPQAVSEAILRTWLDPKVDLSHQLTSPKPHSQVYTLEYDPQAELEKEQNAKKIEPTLIALQKGMDAMREYALHWQEKEATLKQAIVGIPSQAIKSQTISKTISQTIDAKDAQEVTQPESNTTKQAVEKLDENVNQTENPTINKTPKTTELESKEEQKQKEEQKKEEQKTEPENPEFDLRPIEDPLPKNKRFA